MSQHVLCGDNCFLCQHCNTTQPITTPISIPSFVLMSEAFEQQHKDCPKPERIVVVGHAPVSSRYWQPGDTAAILNGQIRLRGCWFDFDSDRFDVADVEA